MNYTYRYCYSSYPYPQPVYWTPPPPPFVWVPTVPAPAPAPAPSYHVCQCACRSTSSVRLCQATSMRDPVVLKGRWQYSPHSRTREPENGHCFLMCFKEKHWPYLKRKFGPNTDYTWNTPPHVLLDYANSHPRMVSSRRDLKVERTGNFLCHISPGGNLSAWDVLTGTYLRQ